MELVVMLLMMLAVVTVLVLTIRALSMSNRKRVCPVCGSQVKRGLTKCATCQHDFAAAHQSEFKFRSR
jgi:ribosomal protein L37AE/L43A